MIDLRSDTVTRPTPGMLQAMMDASIGDDVFHEDPTVIQLEQKMADMFGMEAALYCPSGTMTNQIAIKIQTNPLDEVICDRLAHVYNYEGGGMAFNSAVSIRPLQGDRGRLSAKDVLDNINPDDVHCPITSLVALENTCNKGGGCYYDFNEIKAIHEACRGNNLSFHLDGARLFNALAETSETTKDYGALFDTISICLSKGLGAPIGSVLVSSADNIKQARRVRKVLGGAMRQVGYLAAAGIYALDNHIERLKEDHQRAKELEACLKQQSYVEEVLPVDTNIVIFRLNDIFEDEEFLNKLKEQGIIGVQMGRGLMRFVTHLDFDDSMLEETSEILGKL